MAYSATTAMHNAAKGLVNAAKHYADTTDGFSDNISTSEIISWLDTYVTILQNYQKNPVLNKINYTPYINQVLALYPPEEISLYTGHTGTLSGSSKLFKITNSTFSAGDILGFYSRGIKSFQVLDSNKKVIAGSQISADLETVSTKIPAKFQGADLYIKIYGTKGSEFGQYVYEINDPISVDIQAGGSSAGAIQFTGDKDIYKLADSTGFAPITQNGAGEWRVKIESANLSSLTAKLTGTAGTKAEAFALEGNALVADVTRISPKELSKGFTLEVGTTKGTKIGATDIEYTVSLLRDDYAANKQTLAVIDLKNSATGTGSLSGKFSWTDDVDWVKVNIGKVANKTSGDTYAVSGLASTTELALYNTNGKFIQTVSNHEFSVKAAGTYYLQLLDHSAAADTAYTMNVALVGTPPTDPGTVI